MITDYIMESFDRISSPRNVAILASFALFLAIFSSAGAAYTVVQISNAQQDTFNSRRENTLNSCIEREKIKRALRNLLDLEGANPRDIAAIEPLGEDIDASCEAYAKDVIKENSKP